MDYQFKDETYFAVPKSDERDKIEIEIGDSKVPDKFLPQLKIQRWQNEVNLSLRLKEEPNELLESPVIAKEGDKIKYSKSKRECLFYDVQSAEHPEGASEFEVVLKEKPATNKIEFTINTKGLKFLYQPELTKEEIDDGAFRPENVIGSYAVYASENKTNYEGGKEYKSGKVGHIYRPKIVDSNGDTVWGELNVDELAGILSIIIPQKFLDSAIYPVIVDPTFGYTTAGGSNVNPTVQYAAYGSLFTSPSDAGGATVSSLTFYANYSGGEGAKGFICLHSTLNVITNGRGGAVSGAGSAAWRTSSFATPPTISASTEYLLMYVVTYTTFYLYYDTGDTDQGHYDSTNSYSSPQDLGSATHSTRKFSIYATYTPSSIPNKLYKVNQWAIKRAAHY